MKIRSVVQLDGRRVFVFVRPGCGWTRSPALAQLLGRDRIARATVDVITGGAEVFPHESPDLDAAHAAYLRGLN